MPFALPKLSRLPRPKTLKEVRDGLRWFGARVRFHAADMRAPPSADVPFDRTAYGFAQPLLGLKLLLSDRDLLLEALYPAGLLAAACAIYASFKGGAVGEWKWFATFYGAFAALAPLPSVLFANYYARLAALARWRLGLGLCGPREMPFSTVLARGVKQFIIVAVGLAPLWMLAGLVPFVGGWLRAAIYGLWGVHWVVVDAFDDARVLRPGETLRSAEAEDERAPSPWFVRLLQEAADKLERMNVPILAGPLRWFARRCDRLAIHWRGEIAILEWNPDVSFGFALSTATLLATPVLNLLFRPIVLVASTHLLAHLEGEGEPTGLEPHGELSRLSAIAARFEAPGK